MFGGAERPVLEARNSRTRSRIGAVAAADVPLTEAAASVLAGPDDADARGCSSASSITTVGVPPVRADRASYTIDVEDARLRALQLLQTQERQGG